MRYNEVVALLRGDDPFLVWKGVLPAHGCTPFSFDLLSRWPNLRFIHAYPPWSYAYMLPFAFFSCEWGARVYRIVELLLVSAFLVMALLHIHRVARFRGFTGFSFVMLTFVAGEPVFNCVEVGNFGIIVMSSCAAAIALKARGHSYASGIFWALAMVKPQLGALFLLTLLFERDWRALLTTGAVMLFATVLSAVLCSRSPIAMVLAIRKYSQGMFEHYGLCPYNMMVNAAIGVVIVSALWWRFRHCSSVWIRFLPAMVFCVAWSAFRLHDLSMQLLPAAVAMTLFVTARSPAVALSTIGFVFLLALRLWLFREGNCYIYMNYALLAIMWFLPTILKGNVSENPK